MVMLVILKGEYYVRVSALVSVVWLDIGGGRSCCERPTSNHCALMRLQLSLC
jgi:hypothetical protein